MLFEKLVTEFASKNDGFALHVKKLIPSGKGGLSSAPIKSLRLIKRNLSSDTASRYLGATTPDSIDIEILLTAKRNKSLGAFGDISRSLGINTSGVIVHDGIEFHEAIAGVKMGNKVRPVGIFGSNKDAGVIDITNEVERGADGHPTYSSLQKEADLILDDLNEVLQLGL